MIDYKIKYLVIMHVTKRVVVGAGDLILSRTILLSIVLSVNLSALFLAIFCLFFLLELILLVSF